MTKEYVYIYIYSEEYQCLTGILPKSSMKILVDKTIINTFRISKVPVLILYENTKEARRIYGTKNIRNYVHEEIDTLRPVRDKRA